MVGRRGADNRWLAMLVVAGCGLPDVDLEGVHVRLAMDPGLTPCGDAVGHMDRFVEIVGAELGVTPPVGDERITYSWLSDEHFAREACAENVAGCAWGDDTIYARDFPIDHELVHTLASDYGRVPSFFAEGIAVAYQLPAPGTADYQFVPDVPIAEAIEGVTDGHLAGELYPLAGAFVAFLIERDGIGALRRAMQRMRGTDGPRRISSALAAVYGASLEQLDAEFSASGGRTCLPAGYRRKLFECSAPEIEWDGLLWAGHRTLDCAQDDVIGPFYSGTMAAYRTLTVPEDASYALSVVGDFGAFSEATPNAVTLLHCGGCDELVEATIAADAETVTMRLPAGLYSLRFTGPVAAASGVGLRIERVEDP